MTIRHALLRNESGAAAVELALTAPIFFLLLFGAFQGGLMLWTQLGLQHAVERAARCVVATPSICGTTDKLQSYAVSQGLATSLPGTTFSVVTATCGKQITANATVSFVTSRVNLSASSCFPD